MAGAKQSALLLVATMATVLFGMSSAATFTVGGNTGWTIPSTNSFYSTWASQQTVQVGDVLVFNFATGQHTVAPVAKAAYDACNTNNVLSPAVTTGPARMNLTTAGTQYFICTMPGHCNAGQKLAVVVTGPSSTPAPQPSSRPTPTPSPSPAPKPTTSRPSAPPTTSPAAAPTHSSSTASPPQPVAGDSPTSPTTPTPSSPSTPAPSTPAEGSGSAQSPAGNFATPTLSGVSFLSLASVAAAALLF